MLCDTSIDVVFVVDASRGDEKQFNSIKTAIKNVVSGFSFNKTGPRAALVTFASRGLLQMPFALYEDPSNFKNSIDLVSMEDGERRISDGLELTYRDLFSEQAAESSKNPKIVVLITTGQQTKDSAIAPPSHAAEMFHELGVNILAIGVGNDVDYDELASITKDSNQVVVFRDHEDLAKEEVWKNLTMQICYGAGKASILVVILFCFLETKTKLNVCFIE